jgi:hypothetical protein
LNNHYISAAAAQQYHYKQVYTCTHQIKLQLAELSVFSKRQPIFKEIQMSKMMEIKFDSNIYDRIDACRMSDAERQVAINAMHDADLIVDACVWISKKVELIAERLFRLVLKPSLKH